MSESLGYGNVTNGSKSLQQDEMEMDGMDANRELFVNGLPSEMEFLKRVAAISLESETTGLNIPDASDWRAQQVANLLGMLEFGDTTYTTVFLDYALDWLERCEVSEIISVERIIAILTKVVVCDKGKNQKKRVLKIFWMHAHHLPADLLMCLGKIATYYTPEVGQKELKELMQLVENPEAFMQMYTAADVHKTPFSTDPNSTTQNLINECHVKVDFWGDSEKNLVNNNASKWIDSESLCFLELDRLKTAKECMRRLEQTINYMSSDTNVHESQLLASVMRTVMATEIEALNSMREEEGLHHRVADRLHKLSLKHTRAYNILKAKHLAQTAEFFQCCHKEKDDEIKDSIYKKAKCLTSIEKAKISTDVRLTSEDLLKKIVNTTGGALKEAEGRLENSVSSECALCYSNFCSTRMRACFAPCGHTSACLPCATRAWQNNPRCPWCKAHVEKPIALPPKLFF